MARNDAIVNGIKPKRGMFLVNRSKGKTYGRILRVTDECVVWESFSAQTHTGYPVKTDHDSIHANGYEYTIEPLEGGAS